MPTTITIESNPIMMFKRYRSKTNSKLAVSAHLFYPDASIEILQQLKKSSSDFTLFVTHSGTLDSSIEAELLNLGRLVHRIIVPNYGRDVHAFLKSLQHPEMKQHDYVLKVHTKRGTSEVGEFWRRWLMSSLIGKRHAINRTIKAFDSEPDLVLVGPQSAYISAAKFMYQNQWYVDDISAKLLNYYRLPDWGFFAGTMFVARRNIFDQFLDLERKHFYFDFETGSEDGRLEHAFERMFGILPHFYGKKVGLIKDLGDRKIEIIDGVGTPSRTAITATMRELRDSRHH